MQNKKLSVIFLLALIFGADIFGMDQDKVLQEAKDSLFFAVAHGREDDVRRILESGVVSPNATKPIKDGLEWTLLMAVVCLRTPPDPKTPLNIARILIEFGEDLHRTSPFGTPLEMAVNSNNLKMVECLLAHQDLGSDAAATLAKHAQQRGHLEVGAILFAHEQKIKKAQAQPAKKLKI